MSAQPMPAQQATVSSVQNQCRLCLQGGSERIFKNADPDSKWAFKIKFTLNIEVKNTDRSQTLCHECKTKVEEIYDFKSEKLKFNAQHYGSSMIAKSPNMKQEPDDQSKPLTPFGYCMGGNNSTMMMYGLDASGKFVPVPVPMMPMMPLHLSSLGASAAPIIFPSTPVTTSKPELANTTTLPGTVSLKEPVSESVGEEGYSVDALIDAVNTDQDTNSDSEKSDGKKCKVEKSDDKKSSDGKKNDDKVKDGTKSYENKECEKSDEEEDDKKSSSKRNVAKSHRKKNGKKSCDKTDSENSSDEESKSEKSDKASNDRPLSTTPSTNRARRGLKRRGSSLRYSGRLSRPRTEPEDSKTLEARTGRSLRARPTQKKIVDSDSDDGDFNPDDPDDPADPNYFNASPRKRTISTSSSSSSNDSNDDKKNDKSEIVSQILRRNREEKEDALKKSCPNCNITYKNWTSYDDHVKTCFKSKNAKKGEQEEEKEEDAQKLIKCIVCLKRVTGKKALREHMSEHQVKKEPSYECKTCKEVFPDKGKLICHNALSHRPVPIEPIVKPGRKKLHCDACNEDFENSGDLICHEVLHHKKK